MEFVLSAEQLEAELAQMQAEAIGWKALGDGAYLHVGDPDAQVIDIVGVVSADMADMNLVWLT
jgi:hypothetical protein